MAKADNHDAVEKLEKLLAVHKRLITEMMLRTENLEAAIQLVRQEHVTKKDKTNEDGTSRQFKEP